MRIKMGAMMACALLLFTLQGCAIGLRNEPLPEVNRLDLRVSTTPSLKTQVKMKAGNTAASRNDLVEKTRRNIETLIADANLAMPISTAADADITIDANLYYEPASFGPVIALLSLGTIPGVGTDEINIEASAWRGSKRTDYKLYESYTNIIWWPLIVAAPFKPFIAKDVVLDNMLRTLVLRMKSDGVFN